MKKSDLKKIMLGFLGSAILIFSSCEKDDNTGPEYNTKVVATASFDQTAMKKSLPADADIVLESFKIIIKEIEFELDDDDKEMYDDDYYSDIELSGPFELNLLDNGSGLEEILATVTLPEAEYDEVEFEIEKGNDPSSDMYGKSVRITGTINGVPFDFWTDESEDIELEFEGSNKLTVDGVREAIITLYFDLSSVFNYTAIVTYLGEIADNDDDGLIEINPMSDDGYVDFEDDIWEKFVDSLKALEDDNDDDDDDYDDDNDEDDSNDDDDDDDDK
jgi:hypothetical protein